MAFTRLKPTSSKPRARNKEWRRICLERAEYLENKYGHIVCEYSGETIRVLSTVPNDFDEGWGHHRDRNRWNCTAENCYLVKFKYHQTIHFQNLKVKQEGFEGYELPHRVYTTSP